ncbi:hypothetical protein ACFE04_002055 [Oxalis oulophora]
MAAAGASPEGFFRSASISGNDIGIERRPYHKNCGCALHKSKGHCQHTASNKVVSYPLRRAWSEGSLTLAMTTMKSTSPGSHVHRQRQRQLLYACDEEDDQEV